MVKAVQANLRPSHNEKIRYSLESVRALKRITFNPREAKPDNTFYVSVHKLNENVVLVPGSFTLLFNINLAGRYENNFLVQNVTRALVDRLVVK